MWGITRFNGAFYVRRRYLQTTGFRITFIPGLCPYKFLYVWVDFWPDNGARSRKLGWMYWLANPIFPFIWFRVAIPQNHVEILVEDVVPPKVKSET